MLKLFSVLAFVKVRLFAMGERTHYSAITACFSAIGALIGCAILISTINTVEAFSIGKMQSPGILHYVKNGSGFKVEDINGNSGEDIYVKIHYPRGLNPGNGAKAWVRIIGMPEALSFSKGTKINDIWFMSIADLNNLVLKSPKEFQGSFAAKFFLMRGNKSVVSIVGKSEIQVELSPRRRTAVKKAPAASETVTALVAVEQQPLPMTDTERHMNDRASKLLKMGDFASARLIYENYALKGSAHASFAMGKTFDPEFFRKFVVHGLKPDAEKAKKWYQKAATLGAKGLDLQKQSSSGFEGFVTALSKRLGFNSKDVTNIQRDALVNVYKKSSVGF